MSAVLDKPQTVEAKTKAIPKFETEVVERVTLSNISWETYERILAEHEGIRNPHFFYNDGELEIMVLGSLHEMFKARLSELIVEIARNLEFDYESTASTTFRKEKSKKGFEGDDTFYFKNAELIRAKKEIDLTTDPSPELVLEIDITHGSMSKFPIFAGLEIEEIWRFDGEDVKFYRLEKEKYKEIKESICLEGVSNRTATELLFAMSNMTRMEWIKLVHRTIKGK